MTLPEKSIALLAHSQRTRDLGPTHDPDWITFGLNNVHRFIPPMNIGMQIHTPEYLAAHPAYSKEDLRYYETCEIPIVAQRHYPQWPTSFPMPLGVKHRVGVVCPIGCTGDTLRHRFPRVPWTSTMAYMIGLAILWIEQSAFPESLGQQCRPARRFGLWGFDTLDDYSTQGPAAAYLIAEADHAGIECVVPQSSGFLREPFTYGFDSKKNALRRRQIDSRLAELQGVLRQLDQKIGARQGEMQQLMQRKIAYEAQISENQYQRKNWTFDFDEDDAYLPDADGRVKSLNGNLVEAEFAKLA